MVPSQLLKQVRGLSVTPRWNSSSSTGAGSAQGGEDSQDREERPPRTCPAESSQWFEFCEQASTAGHGFSSWKAGATTAKGPGSPGLPHPGPLLPASRPCSHLLIPGVPRGVSPQQATCWLQPRLPPLPFFAFFCLNSCIPPGPRARVLFVPAQPVHQSRAKAMPEARSLPPETV